jgi:oligopeptide/dipeptide ABC transporter, ATP-binding protein, C-terminal domain
MALTEEGQAANRTEVLLDVRNLVKYFPVSSPFMSGRKEYVKAVDGVSFTVARGETLGLVGESGCGKTSLSKTVLRLTEPTGGEVYFQGKNIFKLNKQELRKLWRKVQIIFQDPYSSLNPRMSVADIIGEPLTVHKVNKDERKARVKELMELVGLSAYHAGRYPHEFSGGQRQRIGIARALALKPELIVCDEPVSALDVSIQSQILNLLGNLQKEFGLTYIFIAHGLAVVKHISSRVGVMYLGKLVELAESETLYHNPRHPYTQALMSSIPIPDPEVKPNRILLEGDVPSPINPPAGCRFHTRCKLCMPICKEQEPRLTSNGDGHFVACHKCNNA